MRKSIASMLCLGAAILAGPPAQGQISYSNSMLALHPVAYWQLNESTSPGPGVSAVANSGSLGSAFNAPIQGNIAFGYPGALTGTNTAAGFDGSTALAKAPYATSVAKAPSFTIEAWLLSHATSVEQCPLSDVDANNPRSGWLIYMDASNPGQYNFRTYNQNGTSTSLSLNIGAANSILNEQWYHLVVVVSNAVTATNVYAYVNGVLTAGPTALTSYVPNDGVNGGFTMGSRTDGGFLFNGALDEVAFYNTALDGGTIATHYAAGTAASPPVPYKQLVLNSTPLLYYRLDDGATLPTALNLGSLGAAANGAYQPGTVPGVAGPSFSGLPTTFSSVNLACQFSPSGTQQVSNPGPGVAVDPTAKSTLNITGTLTLSAWIKVPKAPVGWFTGVLGRGDSAYRFGLDTGGLPRFANGGNGNGDVTGATPVNDGNWHLWTGVYNLTTSNAVLYIDTQVAGTAVWNPPPGSTTEEFFIGGAPDYGNRNFVGSICQVAVLTNSLTAAQVTQLYNSGAPSLFSQAVVTLGPVAYWPLGETNQPPPDFGTVTVTNYGTLGTVLDAPVTGTYSVAFGYPGALASDSDTADGFDGQQTAGFATYARSAYTADIANGPSFTIEAWLLTHQPGYNTQCPLSDVDANSPRSGWLLYMDISNPGQYTFRTYNQNGTAASLSMNIGAANSILADKWYHVVVVVSNAVTVTNVYAYINGSNVVGPVVLPSFVPNDGVSGGFTVGARTDGGFGFNGAIDEVAYYTNALDAATVLAHYQAGTNSSPATPYAQLVQNQSPVIYYRLDEAPPQAGPYAAPLPVATNYGLAGTLASGYYQPTTIPGVAGPTNAGFGLNSLACSFSPGGAESSAAPGPGVVCAPFDPAVLKATAGLTLAAWVQVPAGSLTWFSSIMGCGDNSYRMDLDTGELPHFAAAPNGDVNPATGTYPQLNDGLWHFWSGVFDPVAGKSFLYIDGSLVSSAAGSPLTGPAEMFLIGGVADYNNRNFYGNMAHVAIFTNALTGSNILALYNAVGEAPTATLSTNAFTIDQGSSGTLAAAIAGTPPLGIQWYTITPANVTNLVAGQTSATLSLVNVQPSQDQNQYFVVVTNIYGTAISSSATLTVVQGPPQIQVDVTPAFEIVPVGVPVTYSVFVTGTSPFHYQWYLNGTTPIPGATASTYTPIALAGTNTYDVVITNSVNQVTSATATLVGVLTPPPVITFNNNTDATGWSLNLGNAITPTIVNNVLTLTDGNPSESSSAFAFTEEYIGGFVTFFTYTAANGSAPLADGTTFCVQNSPNGATATGGAGGSLGYNGITPSAAFEINIYNGANGGVGIQFGTNGATADTTPSTAPYVAATPVNVASLDPINVRILYSQGIVSVLLVDTTTGAVATRNYSVGDLTAVLGSAVGYIGFTGGTGGANSIQTVSNFRFSYTTPPILSFHKSGGNIVISWPVSVSTFFVLQSSSNLLGPWTNVGITPTIVNGQNNITVNAASGNQFFRLEVQ